MVTTCGLCGRDFDEDRSQPTCRACPVGEGCGLVRCPWCSYENPAWPGWMRVIGRWLGRIEGRDVTLESSRPHAGEDAA